MRHQDNGLPRRREGRVRPYHREIRPAGPGEQPSRVDPGGYVLYAISDDLVSLEKIDDRGGADVDTRSGYEGGCCCYGLRAIYDLLHVEATLMFRCDELR